MNNLDEDNKFFKDRGFGKSLGLDGKICFIVVDVIKGFTNTAHPLGADLSNQINKINTFLNFCKNEKIPTIFTRIAYENADLTDKGIWFHKMQGLETLIENTTNVELDERLDCQQGDSILTKKYASAFFGTDLATRLTTNNIDTVIISGTTTSGCVRATVVDAIQSGFRPIVLDDSCGDRSIKSHEQSLFDMKQKYADILSTEDCMNSISKTKKGSLEHGI